VAALAEGRGNDVQFGLGDIELDRAHNLRMCSAYFAVKLRPTARLGQLNRE